MVSQAIAPSPSSKRPFVLRKGISMMSDLRDGGAGGYPGDYKGRVYYVNNIHGASTNTGLSWDQCFAQPSEAITASEAYRATHASGNDNIANVIYIQGTNTTYTGITDTGERCDYVGVSAGTMFDGGSGQVRIGSSSTDGVDDATNMRGCGWYNIQFLFGGDTMYGFRNTAYVQRSRFIECTFMMAGNDGEACASFVNVTGTLFERNHFASNASGQPVYGVTISGQNSDCKWFGNNFSSGSTALFNVAGNGVNTVIAGNYFNPVATSGDGFLDSSAGSFQMLAGNYFAATTYLTDAIDRTSDQNSVGNWVSGTGTAVSTST